MTASSLITTLFLALWSLQAVVYARSNLPVFFFHEVMGSANASQYISANMTAEGRVFNALDFCTGNCTFQPLNTQVSLALKQIRDIITKNPDVYKNGYTFVGHSQGATIARAVIEQMDEHNVTTFISLAGMQNGLFYGDQDADVVPIITLVQAIGPAMIPPSTFNFSGYVFGDVTGKLQSDMYKGIAISQTMNDQYAFANLMYQPDCSTWKSANPFLPGGAGPAQEELPQTPGRVLLRLTARRHRVSVPDLAAGPNMTVLPMNQTYEYVHDTYGLQTLDKRNGVHLYNMTAIPHQCWIHNATFVNSANSSCIFDVLYDSVLYPVLNYVR